jgi:hypothetical protein
MVLISAEDNVDSEAQLFFNAMSVDLKRLNVDVPLIIVFMF